jgi:enoyl-CoA hydratase/carnithine racemase
MPRARELASKIAAHSPTALAHTKRLIWESLNVGLEEAAERTWNALTEHNDHPDFSEGPMAMLEKRKPRWKPYTG